MEVRREFFTKNLMILLGLGLTLTACGRGGGFNSPSADFFSQEKTATPPKEAVPPSSADTTSPQDASTSPGTTPAKTLPAASIPDSLEKYITRLKPNQDLPLVAGRIDIRDVDTRTTVLERLGGLDYRFSCGSGGNPGSQDVVLKKDLALLIKRDGEGSDSLRREFEFALIRCRQ